MTKPRLRRWHFDLAIFVGLLLFGLSYWYIFPRPRSVTRVPTDPTINMGAASLGFSTDGPFYYTLKDAFIVGNHLPKPMTQRWNVEKGELLKEYPLQMPAEDVAYMKPMPRGAQHFFYTRPNFQIKMSFIRYKQQTKPSMNKPIVSMT